MKIWHKDKFWLILVLLLGGLLSMASFFDLLDRSTSYLIMATVLALILVYRFILLQKDYGLTLSNLVDTIVFALAVLFAFLMSFSAGFSVVFATGLLIMCLKGVDIKFVEKKRQ